MSLLQQMDRLDRLANEITEHRQTVARIESLSQRIGGTTDPVPLRSQSFQYTAEGAETPWIEADVVRLPTLRLPSKDIGWDLADGLYRIELTLDAPGTFTVARADGAELIRNRYTARTAVVDVSYGALRIASTTAIREVRVLRMVRRTPGEIVLGPFEADGEVRVSVVGHGGLEAQVAWDYDVYRRIVRGRDGLPELAPTRAVRHWTEAQAAALKAPAQGPRPIPYSVAVQFVEPGMPDLPDPLWRSTLRCGRVLDGDPETNVYEQQQVVDAQTAADRDYWLGVGKWGRLPGDAHPAFEPEGGVWTVLWGRVARGAELLTSAYAANGQQVPPDQLSVPGRYLLRRDDYGWYDDATLEPDGSVLYKREVFFGDAQAVELDGVWCAYGEPLRYSDDPLADLREPVLRRSGSSVIIEEGEYLELPYATYPRRFLIRVQGAGVLRAVDVHVTSSSEGPGGPPIQTTYRVPVSNPHRTDGDRSVSRRAARPAAGVFRSV